jgi:hypothetical protein
MLPEEAVALKPLGTLLVKHLRQCDETDRLPGVAWPRWRGHADLVRQATRRMTSPCTQPEVQPKQQDESMPTSLRTLRVHHSDESTMVPFGEIPTESMGSEIAQKKPSRRTRANKFREHREEAILCASLEATYVPCPESHINVSIKGLAALLEDGEDSFWAAERGYNRGDSSCEESHRVSSKEDSGEDCNLPVVPSQGSELPTVPSLPSVTAPIMLSSEVELQITSGLDRLVSDTRATHPITHMIGKAKGECMCKGAARALQHVNFTGATDALRTAIAASRQALEFTEQVGSKLQSTHGAMLERELPAMVEEAARRLQIIRKAIGIALIDARAPSNGSSISEAVAQQLERLDPTKDPVESPVVKARPLDLSGTSREDLQELLQKRMQDARRDSA